VTKQNEDLRRENKALAAKADSRDVRRGVFGSVSSGAAVASQEGVHGQICGADDASESGGDPTSIAQPQEVGNLHFGKVSLNAYYDFDSAGFHLDTPDKELSFAVSGLTQLDGMLYSRPTPGVATSGFYNPATWIIFKGHATEPIFWEF